MAKAKTNPTMALWLKHGHSCRKALGLKPFKKSTPAQKRRLEACVMAKGRTNGKK